MGSIAYTVMEGGRLVTRRVPAKIRMEGNSAVLGKWLGLAKKKMAKLMADAGTGRIGKRTLELEQGVSLLVEAEGGGVKATLTEDIDLVAVYFFRYADDPHKFGLLEGFWKYYYLPARGNQNSDGLKHLFDDTEGDVLLDVGYLNGKLRIESAYSTEFYPPVVGPHFTSGLYSRTYTPTRSRLTEEAIDRVQSGYTRPVTSYLWMGVSDRTIVCVESTGVAVPGGIQILIDRFNREDGAFIDHYETSIFPIQAATASSPVYIDDDGVMYQDLYDLAGNRMNRFDVKTGVWTQSAIYYDDTPPDGVPDYRFINKFVGDLWSAITVCGDYVFVTHKKTGYVVIGSDYESLWQPSYQMFVLDKVTLALVAALPVSRETGCMAAAQQADMKKGKPGSFKYVAQKAVQYEVTSTTASAVMEYHENIVRFDPAKGFTVKRIGEPTEADPSIGRLLSRLTATRAWPTPPWPGGSTPVILTEARNFYFRYARRFPKVAP